MSCLRVKIQRIPTRFKATISVFCGANIDFTPLLVDEGYLLIDVKGVQSFLFVKR